MEQERIGIGLGIRYSSKSPGDLPGKVRHLVKKTGRKKRMIAHHAELNLKKNKTDTAAPRGLTRNEQQ